MIFSHTNDAFINYSEICKLNEMYYYEGCVHMTIQNASIPEPLLLLMFNNSH